MRSGNVSYRKSFDIEFAACDDGLRVEKRRDSCVQERCHVRAHGIADELSIGNIWRVFCHAEEDAVTVMTCGGREAGDPITGAHQDRTAFPELRAGKWLRSHALCSWRPSLGQPTPPAVRTWRRRVGIE